MKDFTGRDLKHNDLVVSKPGGRNAQMKYGLIRNELNTVWFSPGIYGGSDIVLIETDNYPDLEDIRQNLVANREKDIVDRVTKKQTNKNRRLKKSQLKRFGIYECDNSFDREFFLGNCKINNKTIDNVWMKIPYQYNKKSNKKSNIIFPEEGSVLDFWRTGAYNTCYVQKYRTVKFPQKFKEVAVFTEDDMKDMQQKSMERMREKFPYSSDIDGKFIEILF